jgi:hypothetical protein
LNHPQDFRLKRRGHVADFVQEKRAFLALLEFADAPPRGARERTGLVSEEFAFQKLFRDRRTVDGQKRFVCPCAMRIQGACDKFLSRAALPNDQDIDGLRRNPSDRLAHLLHDGAATYDLIRYFIGRQDRRHLHQARRIKRAFNDLGQPFQVQRLDEIVEAAAFHRFDGGLRGPMRRNEDHGPLRCESVNFSENLQPRAVWQLQVHNDHIRILFPDESQPLLARCGRYDFNAVEGEDAAKGIADAFLVINDQQCFLHG